MYFWTKIFVIFSTIVSVTIADSSCKGCVDLDEFNFNKIVSRFKTVLVKFDMVYPYGTKQDIFAQFAEEIINNKNVLVAEVGVKDFGDNDNENIAKKYGLTKDDFPSLKLFNNGILNKCTTFPKETEWNLENIRDFVKKNSDIYIGLPGCSEKMDNFALEFINADDKYKKYKEIEKKTKFFVGKENETAKSYLKYMKKIIDDGPSFINQENERIRKLLKEPKLNEKLKQNLRNRKNILKSLQIFDTHNEL